MDSRTTACAYLEQVDTVKAREMLRPVENQALRWSPVGDTPGSVHALEKPSCQGRQSASNHSSARTPASVIAQL